MSKLINFSLMAVACLVLIGCANNPNITNDEKIITKRERPYAHMDKILGEDTLLFTPDSLNRRSQNTVGIGINSYLWRASLDTVSFMSLRSVDPFGGVIITEWYTADHNPLERFKVDILISSRSLRADGVRVNLSKQVLKNNQWVNADVDAHSATTFEDAILMRARQIYSHESVIKS